MIPDCKIKVTPEESKIVQEIAFEHGYEWEGYKKMDYLFIDNSDMTITYPIDENYFKKHTFPEISFDEFVKRYSPIPEKWIVKVTPENADILTEWKRKISTIYSDPADSYQYVSYKGDGCTRRYYEDIEEITFEQFQTFVLPGFKKKVDNELNDQTMKKKIIGYKPKPDAPIEAIDSLSTCACYDDWKSKFRNYYDLKVNSDSIENFKKYGVLDLWFDPVYEEQNITMPFGDHEVTLDLKEKTGYIKLDNGLDYSFSYKEAKEAWEWYRNRPVINGYRLQFEYSDISFGCIYGRLEEILDIVEKFEEE